MTEIIRKKTTTLSEPWPEEPFCQHTVFFPPAIVFTEQFVIVWKVSQYIQLDLLLLLPDIEAIEASPDLSTGSCENMMKQ